MITDKNKITVISKLLLITGSIALVISIFVPLWKIDLQAPQYPEGLVLLIYPDKLGGNVEIINGLNHYIGMKTLHTEDFFEFKILKYIIGLFAALFLAAAFISKRKFINGLLILFIVFGMVAMYDFWRWEYDYGHDLNPDAAIIVPGMAYQPPLIGFKQLLNFGAYSIPALGGWLFIVAGVLLLVSVAFEAMRIKKIKSTVMANTFLIGGAFALLSSCTASPEPIKLNVDNCSHCQMTIADNRYSCEAISNKGRVYKFDDFLCLRGFVKSNAGITFSSYYVSDFLVPHNLVSTSSASFIKGNGIDAPMGGDIAGFSNADSAKSYEGILNAKPVTWDSVLK